MLKPISEQGPLSNFEILGPLRAVDLIDHSHGLQCLAPLPYTPEGFIDAEALLEAVSTADPLADPRHFASYGRIGHWLLAAILERTEGSPIGQLLKADLKLNGPGLRAQGHERNPDGAWRIVTSNRSFCPARGGDFALSLQQMMAFIQAEIERSSSPEADRQPVRPPLASRSLGLGFIGAWRSMSGGILGHDGAGRGYHSFIRFEPRCGDAIIAIFNSYPAELAYALVFGDHLPEFKAQPVGADALPRINAAPGVYNNCGDHLEVKYEESSWTLGGLVDDEPVHETLIEVRPMTYRVRGGSPLFQEIGFFRERREAPISLWTGTTAFLGQPAPGNGYLDKIVAPSPAD